MAKKTKIFVLDTSVLLHDHQAITNFEKNDVAIPITVLEELDKFKLGNDTKNFSAREVIRFIDKLSNHQSLQNWTSLGTGKGSLCVVFHTQLESLDAEKIFSSDKNDNKIINAGLILKSQHPRKEVILVTKDINLRIKAKALGLMAEDYESDMVKNFEEIESNMISIDCVDSDVVKELFNKGFTENIAVLGNSKVDNGNYIIKNGKSSVLAYYNPFKLRLERVEKEYAYGIKPKNAEQAFAVRALLNPDIKLVSLQGVAGTGKTLLALACALEQANLYDQIILARPIVPLSNKEIGFLPGDANEKIAPYMEPLWDNLKFIKNQFKESERKYKSIVEMEQNGKIIITPLAFIRGRSFSNTLFIVDESQNLTPHEVKTVITRAGEGTKIVFTGDIHQIDSPYLDERSNGLTYLIDRLKGHRLFSHIKLEKGERSELANLANELL